MELYTVWGGKNDHTLGYKAGYLCHVLTLHKSMTFFAYRLSTA